MVKKDASQQESPGDKVLTKISVVPKEVTGLWGRFKKRVHEVIRSDEFRKATSGAKRAAVLVAHEDLRARSVKNDQIEAQIKRELAETDKLIAEKQRLEAEAFLIREQAFSTKAERIVSMAERLGKLGYEMVPVTNENGEEGIFLKRIVAPAEDED